MFKSSKYLVPGCRLEAIYIIGQGKITESSCVRNNTVDIAILIRPGNFAEIIILVSKSFPQNCGIDGLFLQHFFMGIKVSESFLEEIK